MNIATVLNAVSSIAACQKLFAELDLYKVLFLILPGTIVATIMYDITIV